MVGSDPIIPMTRINGEGCRIIIPVAADYPTPSLGLYMKEYVSV